MAAVTEGRNGQGSSCSDDRETKEDQRKVEKPRCEHIGTKHQWR